VSPLNVSCVDLLEPQAVFHTAWVSPLNVSCVDLLESQREVLSLARQFFALGKKLTFWRTVFGPG
jgi:hypothetical protein